MSVVNLDGQDHPFEFLAPLSEIVALGLREEAGHWGPIINRAAEVRSASQELMLAGKRKF